MLASEFLHKLKTLSRDELIEIKGIGDVLADNFLDFLKSDRYLQLIVDFEKLEQNPTNRGLEVLAKTSSIQASQGLPLSRETICITGSFDISRPEIKSRLEDRGAKVTDSVSSNTTILLAGEKAGSKLEKAKKLGVRVVEDLTELLD